MQRAAVSAWEPASALFSLLLQPRTHASSRRLALAQVLEGFGFRRALHSHPSGGSNVLLAGTPCWLAGCGV